MEKTERRPRQRPKTSRAEANELKLRDREILTDIILLHIESGEPVSSRAVSKCVHETWSPATIRNVMADLEDLGLLVQPHTSAGRVPTTAAYRMFVDQLMRTSALSARDRRYIEQRLGRASADADQLMSEVPTVLAELSRQVGVVLTPTVGETVLKAMEFVPLDGRKVLCVIVSTGGFIDHVMIETEEPIERDELVRISNYLNEHFRGLRLAEIRDRLLLLMAEERAHVDGWFARAIDLAQRAMDGAQQPEVLVEGTSALLDRPELQSMDSVRRMLDTFADKARLVRMLNRCLASDGLRVFIGEDSEVTSALDFSLVAVPYGDGERPLGTLGILGPSRMEYPRIVPLVLYFGETLSRALKNRH